jgi:anti-sigma factor RsiW
MTHVEEGVLQAYLDAEVTAGARADIDKHLHSCSACAAELQRMRSSAQLFSHALRDSDVGVPMLPAQARFAAARRFERMMPTPRPRRAFARAAMFIVGLGAVASAAVPGSPVRGWISDALIRVGLLDAPQTAEAPPPLPEAAPVVQEDAAESTTLAIDAVNGGVRIVLKNVSDDAAIEVRLVDGDRALVEARGVAARARFRTGAGLLEVDGIEGGSVVVEIPKSAVNAVVLRDGQTIYRVGR